MQGVSACHRKINGCSVTMFFAETQEERITEHIKAILSCSYEERVQSDLRLAVKEKAEKGGCTMPEERMENV
ncbi:MAG: hypothetical protein IJ733_11420 [Lachnospiraceae bacterium]|nr:hypothetical protein [Lachnospiraceae bacterium]